MSKQIKTRIQNKHDIEANWLQATNFVPLAGEIIIYDPDENHDKARFKVGDGIVQADGTVHGTKVSDLPFITIDDIPEIPEIPEVPTKTSELTNDSGFITINDVPDCLEALQGAEINFASTTPELSVINEAGIHIRIPEVEIETPAGKLIAASGRDTIPIVAGENVTFTTNSNNTVSINAIKELPTVSASDAGKILMVGDDGNIVVQMIPFAEEAEF